MTDVRRTGTRVWVDDLYCRDGDAMRLVPGVAQVTVMRDAMQQMPIAILYGDHVRFKSHLHTPHSYHNPGAIDWERKAASDGVAWTGSVESPEWIMVVDAGHWSLLRAIDQWRQLLSQQIATIADPEIRGSAAALILGSAGLLPEKFGDGLRYWGIIHLYVISGLHVAVVAWAVYELIYWLLSRRTRWALRLPLWRWSAVASLIAVWVYVGLVGGGVAVVRAGIMVTAYLAALILDRHPHVGAAIALAALLLIVQSPHVIFVPGFQLSFVAVIALVAIYPRVMTIFLPLLGLRGGGGSYEKGRGLWHGFTKAIIAALVATWATAPIVAYHFHQTPLLGIPANLIAGPYTTIVLMPIGFAWTLLAGIPSIAALIQQLWIWAAWPLVRAIEWATPLAESTQWTFTPNFWEMVWWYSLIIPLSLWERARVRRWFVIAWTFIGLLLISLCLYDHYRPQPLQLTFLDVGQGAAVLVEFPNRHTMLIDAGGAPGSDFDVGRWVVAPALLARGITHIDDLLLTHPHPDHYGGLAYIAEHFHSTRFLTNGAHGDEGDVQWQAFMSRMQTAQLKPEVVHRGMQMSQGEVQVTWHHPPATGPDELLGKNNGSVVTDIRYGAFRALIVGDIEREAEAVLARDAALESGPISVLQVPHHASRTSSTPAFLQHMQPQVAIAQLGFENRYGFPHPEVTRRYDELGTVLCRTDRDGAATVTVNSPTRQFSIQTDRSAETCSAHLK
jgi:competence protein ComEC